MRAQKKYLIPLTVLIGLFIASGAFATITIDVAAPEENSVFCTNHGGTIDLNVSGDNDGNLFAIYVTNPADGNLWLSDDGNGNIHSDFNAVYADAFGYFEVKATIPPRGATGAANIDYGNLTITIIDLNGGDSTTTTTINVKPNWTETEFTLSPLVCASSDYTTVSGFTLTDTSGNIIKFNSDVNIEGDLDFDASIDLTNTSAKVDTTVLTTLANRNATITWPNLASEGLEAENISVLYNTGDVGAADQECPHNKCLLVTATPGQIELDVSDFSVYSIERANENPWFPGGFPDIPTQEEVASFLQGSAFGFSNVVWVSVLVILVVLGIAFWRGWIKV